MWHWWSKYQVCVCIRGQVSFVFESKSSISSRYITDVKIALEKMSLLLDRVTIHTSSFNWKHVAHYMILWMEMPRYWASWMLRGWFMQICLCLNWRFPADLPCLQCGHNQHRSLLHLWISWIICWLYSLVWSSIFLSSLLSFCLQCPFIISDPGAKFQAGSRERWIWADVVIEECARRVVMSVEPGDASQTTPTEETCLVLAPILSTLPIEFEGVMVNCCLEKSTGVLNVLTLCSLQVCSSSPPIGKDVIQYSQI